MVVSALGNIEHCSLYQLSIVFFVYFCLRCRPLALCPNNQKGDYYNYIYHLQFRNGVGNLTEKTAVVTLVR